jgi:hypothetical protein
MTTPYQLQLTGPDPQEALANPLGFCFGCVAEKDDSECDRAWDAEDAPIICNECREMIEVYDGADTETVGVA